MDKNHINKLNTEVLFIVNQIDENQLTNNSNYHFFHNRITYRHTNKEVLFKNDFFIIQSNELEKSSLETNNFKLIIIESKDIANNITTLYKAKECNKPGDNLNKDKYSLFKNFKKRKIIVQLNDFNSLSIEELNDLVNDINLISTSYFLKNDSKFFDEDGIFGSKNRINYQFTCANCNKYNLIIIHKSEPNPDSCKYCNKPISNSNGKLKTEVLILENNLLRTAIDKL